METKTFARFLAQVPALSAHQRARLRAALAETDEPGDALALVNRRSRELHACPYCSAAHIQRWGLASGIQRYKCCSCHRCFNALTGTPLARLKRRDAWFAFARAMAGGLSVRAAAGEVGVAQATSFRWRHRMLREPAAEEDGELRAIVEAGETHFPLSFKGQRRLARPARQRGNSAAERIPVLVVEDREGHHFDSILSCTDGSSLRDLLAQLLTPESLLCTDETTVHDAIAGEEEIACVVMRRGVTAGLPAGSAAADWVLPAALHIRHVRAYAARLQGWMLHFRGVATRYLPDYLGWRRLIERQREAISAEQILLHAMG